MTSGIIQTGLTARNLLLGDELDPAALRQALADHDVLDAVGGQLSRLTADGREAADDALASATEGLLDLDLGDVLITAWRTQKRLADAARETQRSPGRKEVVQLASHQITSSYYPAVDLKVDDVRVHTFQFQLDLALTIDMAAVTVEKGRLVAVKVGDGSASGTLTLQLPGGDKPLLHRERQINLHLTIRLGDGILLPFQKPPAAAATVTAGARPAPGGWSGWGSRRVR